MPAGPGETLLTTLFADCHYYFSDPSSKPPHHRFDRGSYVYLFYNSTQRQAKIEVANNAGTPEQDAFHGYLNVANVSYNYLQPTLCTLFINTGAVQDQSTWHLPALDQRNEQKYSYKLHAMDIYLWTEKDAATFLGHLKSVLGGDKFDIKNPPPTTGNPSVGTPHSEHRDSMSPVVQLLEKTAVGTHFPPRAPSAVSAQSFPGPPTPATGSGAASPNPPPAPMAYNPAAPAAPEPVQYREKTPPPIDENGTGLAAAAKYESVPQQSQYAYQSKPQQPAAYFSNPPQHQPRQFSQSNFPGPPLSSSSSSTDNIPRTFSSISVPPAPQQQQQQPRAPSFGPMAQNTLLPQSPPPAPQSSHQHQSSYTPLPQQIQHATYTPSGPQFANYPTSPTFNSNLPPTPSAPPAYSTPLQSPGFPGPPPPQQQHAPQQQHTGVPLGGYNTSYSYSSAPPPPAHGEFGMQGGYRGDVHSQVYRPGEGEGSSHSGRPAEGRVAKVEGSVNKFLKKFDKEVKLW